MHNKKLNNKTRVFIDVSINVADNEKDVYTLSFSSETPYMNEILLHGKENVRLERLISTGMVLFNHDYNTYIGKILDVGIDTFAKKCYAKIKFATNPKAIEIKNDVDAGILTNVSVGYKIYNYEQKDGYYYITDWEPTEISLVTVPADITVGVGRSIDYNNNLEDKSNLSDVNEQNKSEIEQKTSSPAHNEEKEDDKNQKNVSNYKQNNNLTNNKKELNNMEENSQKSVNNYQEMLNIAAMHPDVVDTKLLNDFISQGKNVRDLQSYILGKKRTPAIQTTNTTIDGLYDFNIENALRAFLKGKNDDENVVKTRMIAKEIGLEVRNDSLFLPFRKTVERFTTNKRDYTVNVGGVPAKQNYVELDSKLYTNSILKQLGVEPIAVGKGSFVYTKLSSDLTAWRFDETAPTGVFAADNVVVTPKRYQTVVSVDDSTLKNSVIDIYRLVEERFVEQLTRRINLEVTNAITNAVPTENKKTYDNTKTLIANLAKLLFVKNEDTGYFILHPLLYARIQEELVEANIVWTNNPYGENIVVNKRVPVDKIFYGDFKNTIKYFEYGGVEIVNSSYDSNFRINIMGSYYFDVKIEDANNISILENIS